MELPVIAQNARRCYYFWLQVCLKITFTETMYATDTCLSKAGRVLPPQSFWILGIIVLNLPKCGLGGKSRWKRHVCVWLNSYKLMCETENKHCFPSVFAELFFSCRIVHCVLCKHPFQKEVQGKEPGQGRIVSPGSSGCWRCSGSQTLRVGGIWWHQQRYSGQINLWSLLFDLFRCYLVLLNAKLARMA